MSRERAALRSRRSPTQAAPRWSPPFTPTVARKSVPQSATRVSVVYIWRAVIASGAMPFMRVAVLVTLGLALGLASGAMAASPDQDKVLAKQHFESGSRHYDLAEYDQALPEFKEAYRLMPDATFLYNIAQCHRKLGHVDEALNFYKTYRRRAPDAPNREEIERRIQELEAERQAKPSRKAEEERATKAAAEAQTAIPPEPPAETPEPQPVPAPLSGSLPTPVEAAAAPATISLAPANRVDLTQPASNTPAEAAAGTSIFGRWWFWSAVGAVVVTGVTVGLLATRGGSGSFCSDCAATSGVNAK